MSVDNVFFQNAILCIFRHRTENKMAFFESLDQTGSEKNIFHIRNNQFENLSLYNPGLTRPFPALDFHGVRLQNGVYF